MRRETEKRIAKLETRRAAPMEVLSDRELLELIVGRIDVDPESLGDADLQAISSCRLSSMEEAMNRELHRKVRRLEGTRANQRARPRVLPLPPQSDGRPWTDEEVSAARSWRITDEEWTEIYCSELSHEEVEARITAELHRRIEQAKRLQR